MTWLLVSSVCLSAQDLHYLPSSPVLCVLFFFFLLEWFTAASGNQHLVLSRHGTGRDPGPPPVDPLTGVMLGILLSSAADPHQWPWGPAALRLQEVNADVGQGCLLWFWGAAYTALGPRLPPVSVSLCCLVAKSSLTLFARLTHQAPLSRGFPKQEYLSDLHFLLHNPQFLRSLGSYYKISSGWGGQYSTENDWFFIFTVKYSDRNTEKNYIQMQNNLSIYLKIRYHRNLYVS